MFPQLANTVNARNVYPSFDGGTSIGDYATSPFSQYGDTEVAVTEKANESPVDRALAVGMAGEPVKWWLSLVALLVILMYVAQKFDGGESSNYSNLRLSAYNIVIITLSAVIGMSIFKVAATKFPVPGLSTVILAA